MGVILGSRGGPSFVGGGLAVEGLEQERHNVEKLVTPVMGQFVHVGNAVVEREDHVPHFAKIRLVDG